jgi:hypothetical protein
MDREQRKIDAYIKSIALMEARDKKRRQKDVDKENEVPEPRQASKEVLSPAHKRARQVLLPVLSAAWSTRKRKQTDTVSAPPSTPPHMGAKIKPNWAAHKSTSTPTTRSPDVSPAFFSPNAGARTPDASTSIPTLQTPLFYTMPSFSTPIALNLLRSPKVEVSGEPTPFAVPMPRATKGEQFLPLTPVPVSSWWHL